MFVGNVTTVPKNKVTMSGFIQLPTKQGIIMVYASWCPHCHSKKDAVEKLAKQYKGRVFALDASDRKLPPYLVKHGLVPSFPTFLTVTQHGKIDKKLSWPTGVRRALQQAAVSKVSSSSPSAMPKATCSTCAPSSKRATKRMEAELSAAAGKRPTKRQAAHLLAQLSQSAPKARKSKK